jgi:hypothetical protein
MRRARQHVPRPLTFTAEAVSGVRDGSIGTVREKPDEE